MHRTAAAVFAAFLLGTWVVPILAAGPWDAKVTAGYVSRQAELDKVMEQRATEKPKDPESWYTLAKYYADKAQKGANLPREAAQKYVIRGLEVDQLALTINPVYYEALILKNNLLRQRASYEKDPSIRKRLIAEADATSATATEILKKYRKGG